MRALLSGPYQKIMKTVKTRYRDISFEEIQKECTAQCPSIDWTSLRGKEVVIEIPHLSYDSIVEPGNCTGPFYGVLKDGRYVDCPCGCDYWFAACPHLVEIGD